MKLTGLVFFIVLTCLIPVSAQWIKQSVNTTASLRGLSVVSQKVIWASGTGGTVIKTMDSGKTWKVMALPGAEKLDFRDIEAFDSKTAYILSIGNGDSSRIYKTTDGGATWESQFTNKDEKAFYDALACWDKKNCIAMSDPVGGHFPLLSTSDGGASWKQITSKDLPLAKGDEAAFAASGTCLYIGPTGVAYLISGGNDARVFRSTDRGVTWIVADTPIVRGTSGSGIFSIAMFDSNNGVIVGGNYEKPSDSKDSLAFTVDGGERWRPGTGFGGYRPGVAYVDKKRIVAVGSNGADLTTDGGKTWKKIGDENFNSVAAKGKDAVWAVGPKGGVYWYPGLTKIALD
ncbi:MAG: glycosyl hydrolase [Pyrinomonadaceae bacterium]